MLIAILGRSPRNFVERCLGIFFDAKLYKIWEFRRRLSSVPIAQGFGYFVVVKYGQNTLHLLTYVNNLRHKFFILQNSHFVGRTFFMNWWRQQAAFAKLVKDWDVKTQGVVISFFIIMQSLNFTSFFKWFQILTTGAVTALWQLRPFRPAKATIVTFKVNYFRS